MWVYNRPTGELSHNGKVVGKGYSGNGEGLNNPAIESVKDVGPIPAGEYTIGDFFDDIGGKGRLVCHLIPSVLNMMFNRSGFMIHGDNKEMNHTASEGCIILAQFIREIIFASKDYNLTVL